MRQLFPSNVGKPVVEYIGDEEDTQRTETSHVAVEQKSIEIPRVVASEMGTAQTVPDFRFQIPDSRTKIKDTRYQIPDNLQILSTTILKYLTIGHLCPMSFV